MAKMQALQPHSYHGKDHKPGSTYDADDGDVNTIEVQGKGARVDASKPVAKPKPKPKSKAKVKATHRPIRVGKHKK